jgi:EAL domain-containing protein (putative c-di-GMP-specific phosphodiesterase class I)
MRLARHAAPEPLDHSVPLDEVHLAHRVVEERLIAMHFQPIVDIRHRRVFAQEALCRPLSSSRFESPQNLVSAAVRAGRIGELGRLQRAKAVKNCPNWPLFLNVEPNEFDQGWLVRPDDPVFRHRLPIYLEITETAPIKFFDQCHSVLGELRKKGVLLAIDDLGAGFSNLKYIAELEPDMVKLDRQLVHGVRPGSREFGLLQGITRLCHEMRAEVVAEGVETPEELDAVVRAGVDYCQGYLLARPASRPSEIKWPDSRCAAGEPEPRIDRSSPEEEMGKEPSTTGRTAASNGHESSAHEIIEDLELRLQGVRGNLARSEEMRRALSKRVRFLSPGNAGTRPRPASSASPAHHPLKAGPVRAEDPAEPPDRPAPEIPALDLRRIPLAAAVPLSFLLGALVVLLLPLGGDSHLPLAGLEIQPDSAQSTSPTASDQRAELTTPPARPTDAAREDVGLGEEAEADPGERLHVQAATQIEAQIGAWALAWMEHRSEDYLSFYSRDFQPSGGLRREAWEEQRRERVGRRGPISVMLRDPAVSLLGAEAARVTFLQSYESETYRDQVIKTLALVWEGGEWRIVEERVEAS